MNKNVLGHGGKKGGGGCGSMRKTRAWVVETPVGSRATISGQWPGGENPVAVLVAQDIDMLSMSFQKHASFLSQLKVVGHLHRQQFYRKEQ